MQDDWEICNKWDTPYGWRLRSRRIYVSLNRRGEIVMNEAAFKQILSPANVTLLYDRRNRQIGVKCPVKADMQFFPVRRYGRGRRNRIVRASRLLKQFEIAVERTVVFPDPKTVDFKGQPMLVLELDEK